ncbi:IS1380 family transposase [Pelagicoccus mobilis]|uniref:IS1380 family transposase n=1 Tax=Pelagicoccus mobilis TaxID=415221 RepID=A0A934VRB3_9BACT|nr:IS1380 family transposase [Pelagicoccus mobilis]MBK1877448.1 IS1380 family transposase [Pelagicoccus mobilis]
MKLPKRLSRTRKSSIPVIKFERHNLSSYGGLVVFQKLFADLGLSARLGKCVPGGSKRSRHASYSLLWRLLVVNALIGMRRLRDLDHYRDDPIVLKALGVDRLPSVPTVSRMLEDCDGVSVSRLQAQSRDVVLERAAVEGFATVTLDFDGSVISTGRRAEGSAAGFNRKKKGARSYYPLFCTLAQSGQVLDLLHRSGNVHDSNGSVEFVERCVEAVRAACPRVRIEARMGGAFFSEKMIRKLDALGVEYAMSVPFERFAKLKALVEQRMRWTAVPGGERERSAFEKSWKPESWKSKARFLFVRSENPKQSKGRLQLDLFSPVEYGYDYKCVVTNKRCSLKTAVVFLEGRGAQENVFAELKSQGALAYVPCRRLAANQSYMLCSIMAHNLGRELQMRTFEKLRPTTAKRPALWVFEKIQTLRNAFLCKAGRFTRPGGKPTLTLNANPIVEQYMRNYLGAA